MTMTVGELDSYTSEYNPSVAEFQSGRATLDDKVLQGDYSAPVSAAGVEGRRLRQAADDGQAHPQPVIRGCSLQNDKNDVLSALIDWVSFTLVVRDGDTPKQLAEWLLKRLPDGAELRINGRYHYSHGYNLPGGGLVLYHPQRPEMGVHCSLPSGSLSLLDMTVNALFALIFTEGGTVTRLDLAKDSHTVTLHQVKEAWLAGNAVKAGSHSQLFVKYKDGEDGRPVATGETLYIGSRSSEALARFYDKAAQQGLPDGDILTRCEVELKGSRAAAAALAILQGADLSALILNVIDFRDRSADSNVTRCPRLDWWQEWVGAIKRVSFAVNKQLTDSFTKAYEWVCKAVAPTLAFLDAFLKDDDGVPNYRWLWDMCEQNQHRIRPGLKVLLEQRGLV